MRIGIDVRSLLEAHPSGVTMYTAALLEAMLALPERTATICLFSSGWHVPTERIKPLLRFPRVEWQHWQRPNKLAALGLQPRMDQFLHGVDVLFMPNWNFVRVSADCPVVLTIHDCATQLYPHLLSRKRRLWHRCIQPGRQMRQAQQLIAVSHATRQALQEQFSIPPERITVIHSAAPTPVAPQPVEGLPKRYVVAIGAGEQRKNVATLRQAHLPYPLVVIGEQGDFGYVTPEQKWYILQQAEALIYDSLYEGFGFPPLEAFQAGVPVITSFSGAMPEVCGSAAMYVNPYSTIDLERAVNAVCTDQALRQRLVELGKQQLQQLSWRKTAQQTLQVLEQTVY